MNEELKKFTVSFHVEEHEHREVELVTVEVDELEDGVSAKEKAVELASDKSPYTHAETCKIDKRN